MQCNGLATGWPKQTHQTISLDLRYTLLSRFLASSISQISLTFPTFHSLSLSSPAASNSFAAGKVTFVCELKGSRFDFAWSGIPPAFPRIPIPNSTVHVICNWLRESVRGNGSRRFRHSSIRFYAEGVFGEEVPWPPESYSELYRFASNSQP